MFELGRELKRFFSPERAKAPSDGLTGGDSSLLELLDSQLLAQEAKACDVAAGRIGAKDKPRRRLEAAIVWQNTRIGREASVRDALLGRNCHIGRSVSVNGGAVLGDKSALTDYTRA